MSSEQISFFKQYLEFMGFEDGQDYDISGDGDALQFTVRIAIDPRPLPEELKQFAPSPQYAEEMSHNGSCEKRTHEGVVFELALRGWADAAMKAIPEIAALPPIQTVMECEGVNLREEVDRRKALRTKFWHEVTHRPEFLAWEHELDEKYY